MHRLDVVADRFELRRLVGSGGMGDVYQALDRATGELVAVKVLMAHPAGHPLERFRREIQLLAETSDPRIVRYVGHGLTREGRPFLAMEWLEGCELAERLAHGPLSIGETVALGKRVAEGLAVLHARGIVHRDVKPSNIFLVGGAIEGAKLLDFGVARMIDATLRSTKTGVVVGTPGYMAPEQARGESEIDVRADVYALGCVIYECLTGEPLYAGNNMVAILAKILLGDTPRVRELRRDVPRELDALVARMLSRSPAERPANASAAAAELARLPDVPVEPSAEQIPAPGESRAITHTERRLVSVLIVQGAPVDAAPADAADGADRTIAATLDPRLVATQFSAAIEPLADGSLVAVLTGKGTATDQAARAARCALELKKVVGDRPMALATGFATPDSELAAREVIDRAAALLVTPAASASARVRLDDVTAGLLDHRFAVAGDEAGLVLEGMREESTLPRTLLGRPMPFVGRERELSTLLAVVRECDEDSCARPVLVTAPPGVGKTRLSQELMRAIAQEKRAEIWLAYGDAMSEGSPFALLGQAIRAAAGIVDGEPLAVRQMKLRARVARNVPPAAQGRVSEFLGELVGAPFSDGTSVQLRAARQDPRLMGDQMRAAFEELLAAECAAQPVVLVLEDLQWGDLPSVKFVDAALRNLEDLAFTVVGFARPEIEELFPGLWRERNLTEMRLAPLSKRASEALVRSALGADAADERVRRILERASGNAFFLEELIRAAAEGRDEFPATVLAMVESRLERLDGEARRVLRAASVFGTTFWERGVGALLGAERAARAAEWLDELRRRELVDRMAATTLLGERELAFRHTLIREAAYATLTAEDRALGHKLAAQWLESRGEREPAMLAEHYERGGDLDGAVRWYGAAALHGYEGDDFRAAHAHAERAIECGASGMTKGRLRFVQASGRAWGGDFEGSLRYAREAIDALEPGTPERFLAMGALAYAAARAQNVDELLQVHARIERELAPGALSGARAIGAARVAGSLYYGGFPREGDALLARIERQSVQGGDDELAAAAWLHYARSMRAAARAEPEAELTALAAAIDAFDAVGDRRNACNHRVNLGSGLQNFGLLEDAETHLRRGLEDAQRMGLTVLTLAAKHNLGAALTRRGEWVEGIALEREAAEGCHALGDRFLEGAARAYLGTMLRVSGKHDEARAELERAAVLVADAPHALAPLIAQQAMLEVDAGHGERALALAERANDLTKDRGIFEGEAYVRLAYAEALHCVGRIDEARERIAHARARLLERAATIHDPAWRRAFLERVRENVLTLARAAEWAGPFSGDQKVPSAERP